MKINIHTYCLYLTLILCSCKGKNQNADLKIEIINNEIYSRSIVDSSTIDYLMDSDNFIYDSIPVNKINFKITNIGTKKYAFFIKKELDNVENFGQENIRFNVFKDNEILEPNYLQYAIQLTTKGFEFRKDKNEIENDTIKQELNEKYLKEKISIKKIKFQREMNYVVIHPGETKYFSYYRTLPFFLEQLTSYYIYKFNSEYKYFFTLSLKNDATSLKKYITINQLKEIEDNGYVLFNGEIKSNKVPIKNR
ncbi:hypothetical protein WFZ85_15135 [Flavobacterium sp. j3]|uniref:Lipoprotein n=1 Tax=Flavobacterium aureirubrum TaxID=3133147 RepID=A0ABU9N8K3_9FLAO